MAVLQDPFGSSDWTVRLVPSSGGFLSRVKLGKGWISHFPEDVHKLEVTPKR